MSLSQTQQEAIGQTCKKCGIGTYKHCQSHKYGKSFDFVGCTRYPACDGKIYKPRGRGVVTDREAAEIAAVNESGTVIERKIEESSIVTYTAPVEAQPEGATMGGIEQAIVNAVMPHVNAALSKVQVSAEQVNDAVKRETGAAIQLITDELAKLQAAKPIVIEIKRDDSEPTKIEGAHYLMPRLLKLLGAGVHVYLWGPPGSGKSTACLQAAKALGLYAEVDTLDPTTTRSMLQGFVRPDGTPQYTAFSRCYSGEGADGASKGGMYIMEEADNSPAHVQTLGNTALANGHSPFAWGMRARGDHFVLAANGNTPFRPTDAFRDRKPGSLAFMDRLYFLHWPVDLNIQRRICGMPTQPSPKREETTCTPAAWGEYVERMMTWATANAPELKISPRAAIVGVKALSLGETPPEVAAGLIFRGADQEITHKALCAVSLPEGR